jgi:hypothetical protein
MIWPETRGEAITHDSETSVIFTTLRRPCRTSRRCSSWISRRLSGQRQGTRLVGMTGPEPNQGVRIHSERSLRRSGDAGLEWHHHAEEDRCCAEHTRHRRMTRSSDITAPSGTRSSGSRRPSNGLGGMISGVVRIMELTQVHPKQVHLRVRTERSIGSNFSNGKFIFGIGIA